MVAAMSLIASSAIEYYHCISVAGAMHVKVSQLTVRSCVLYIN